MKIISLLELYSYDYSVADVSILRQYWRDRKSFHCIGSPKTKDILVYLDGCKAEYTLKSGNAIYANSGDFIYCPLNSEYSVRFYDFEPLTGSTIGINFKLYDTENNPFILTDQITVFSNQNANYKSMFYKMEHYYLPTVTCIGKLKSILYDLIFYLSEYDRNIYCDKYSIIAKGISYLEEDPDQLLKISDIAKLCNVSEAYFRRLFTDYSGMSPLEYRMTSKICRAKNYLQHDEFSVTEIASQLGFVDASYFIKQFHKKTGMTPYEYKQSFKSQ